MEDISSHCNFDPRETRAAGAPIFQKKKGRAGRLDARKPRKARRGRTGTSPRKGASRQPIAVGAVLKDDGRRAILFANEHHASTTAKRGVLETPNDANDRAIRGVAALFQSAVGLKGGVVLVTDDAACRALMVDEGGAATTTAGLVAGFPGCLDLVADRAAPSSSSDGRA